MENKQVLHSSKIKNLITKFYYEDNYLCFQILLNCEDGESRLFKSFKDYNEYKEEYNRLLEMKASDEYILVGDEVASTTHLSFL